jgi:hypothetical protein
MKALLKKINIPTCRNGHIGNIKMALKRKIISTQIGNQLVPKRKVKHRPPYRENIYRKLISNSG